MTLVMKRTNMIHVLQKTPCEKRLDKTVKGDIFKVNIQSKTNSFKVAQNQ